MHLRSVVHHMHVVPLYARHIRSRGVATNCSPVTTHRVAYALCSKSVVHVNEAKLHGGFVHQGHFISYMVHLLPLTPSPSVLPSFSLLSQSITFKLFAGSDPRFSTYSHTPKESLKSVNNVKIGV